MLSTITQHLGHHYFGHVGPQHHNPHICDSVFYFSIHTPPFLILQEEICTLLRKGGILSVLSHHLLYGFFSQYFCAQTCIHGHHEKEDLVTHHNYGSWSSDPYIHTICPPLVLLLYLAADNWDRGEWGPACEDTFVFEALEHSKVVFVQAQIPFMWIYTSPLKEP